MIHPSRHILSALCFVAIGLLALFWGFPDRTHHFASEASAKTDRAGTYDLGKGRVLTKVIGHVRTHYVDRTRIRLDDMAVRAAQAIQRSVPEVMVKVERGPDDKATALWVSVGERSKKFELGKVSDLYELNWKLMDMFGFLARHLPPETDLESVEYGGVNGVLGTLDPHSLLLSPKMFRDMQVGTKGKFGGLGIVISTRDGFLTVMSVMNSTPAERAGLLSGDIIIQVGEESTVNMPLNDAVSRLRGSPGSPVTLWVRRKGVSDLTAYKIVREEIRIRSVEHKELGKGIGYARVRNFQATTSADLGDALEALEAKNSLTGLVLDLRENPGGLLDQAIAVSDHFLPTGNIVTTVKEGAQEREERHATLAGTRAKLPIVVLINRGSASASEIVAGALKHNNRATIMGTTSYGKGSVQVLYRLDDAALKLTVAQYLTPGDISIQSVGIVPDIEILNIRIDEDHIDLHSDAEAERGEANLKSHLTSAKTTRTQSAIQLKMLQKPPRKSSETSKDAPADSLSLLARDMLLAARSTDRKKALVQAGPTLAKRAALEDKSVAKALKKLGVQWTQGKTPARPKLKLSFKFESAKSIVQAGEKISLVASLTNQGTQTIHRVHGVVHSAVASLDGKEVVFGACAPGETRRWVVPVNIPDSQHAAADLVRLELFAHDQPIGVETHRPIQIEAHARPVFSYAAQVVDPADAGGNGNGMIQRGEAWTLAVRVFNQGKGDAQDVLATIKNESGEYVFIDSGRASLGLIKAGESKVARFKVRVKVPLHERHVRVKLTMIDQTIRTWSHDEITLPVFPAEFEGGRQSAGWVRVGPEGATLHGGAHRDTLTLGTLPKEADLRVVGETSHYWKVRSAATQEGLSASGWVPKRSAKKLSVAPAKGAHFLPTPQYSAPELTLASRDTLLTTDETLTLQGRVSFDSHGPRKRTRSFYIFRGKDKVFFQSGTAALPAFDFNATVPLKKGANDLVLVARESNTHVSRTYLTVFRR